MRHWFLLLAGATVGFITCLVPSACDRLSAQERSGTGSPSTEQLVSQNLLGLLHAPQVHQELNLDREQVRRLEALFVEIDGDWFRSRILPPEKQYPAVAELEERVRRWFGQQASEGQQGRLRQLELQSQSVRMLLREDLGQELGMTSAQKERLLQLASDVAGATRALQEAVRRNQVSDELKSAVAKATEAEQVGFKKILKPAQLQSLATIIGKPFDTSKLERIYPLAPELVSVQDWINSKPLTLNELRGKVVVLHFYAFQCHNCHANFGHYDKWHEEFSDDDVVVLGIQTPETSDERDPSKVRAAASSRNIQYPVLVDLESKNWTAWSNTMWPTVYVIDKRGYIRQWWQGELNWQGATGDKTIHELILKLLQEDATAHSAG